MMSISMAMTTRRLAKKNVLLKSPCYIERLNDTTCLCVGF